MNPVKTLCFTLSLVAMLATSLAAQTVYFFPPGDPEWVAGRSYISQGNASTAQALTIEPTKCGWYKASVPTSSPLRSYAQFWLGSKGNDRIGPNGRLKTDFDNVVADFDNPTEGGGVFRLGEVFSHFGTTSIYLVAEELDPTDPWAGWYGADPVIEDPERCKFELAAFIYDTDPSVHPDFSCGSWVNGLDEGNGASTKGTCEEGPEAYSGAKGNLKPQCTGVVKGLVKATLNSTTRKIEYSGRDPKKCWTDESWFNKAFTSTPGTNVQRCYNMPFTQIKTGKAVGSFEFDSDKMTQPNSTRIIGGFFPELLNSTTGADNPDYSQCSKCATKRSADRFPPKVTKLTKDIFDDYDSQEGDFKDGDTPKLGAFGLTPAADVIYDWGARTDSNSTNPNWSAWYLHGKKALKNTYGNDKTGYDTDAKANQHFCFESHADFYYDPAQEFYFSGDDPIWVYINNKLVIDLGGAHMAAPGHVKLNSLGLEEGKLYPIDIFFCDQRTVNSNVRISTNMYVVQKQNFYNDPDKLTNPMCVLYQGGADCASRMSGNQTTGKKDWCGPDLIKNGFNVDFYMVRRGTSDTIWLSEKPKGAGGSRGDCTGTGKNFTCYKGIEVKDAIYTCGGRSVCKGNAEATSKVDVVGSFNVYARLVGLDGKPSGKPLLIDNFKSETNMRIVWGHLESEDGKSKLDLKNGNGGAAAQSQQIVAGKRTPIYIASGSWQNENTFLYDNDPEFVEGKDYAITVSAANGGTLRIFKTANESDKTPVTSGKLPASGVDTLWAESDYTGGNKEFTLNLSGVVANESAPSMKLTVYQPQLRFVDKNFENPVEPSGFTRWVTDGKPPYVGTGLDVYIEAWDPLANGGKGDICVTCNFTLKDSSWINNPKIPGEIVASTSLQITNGKSSNVYIRGLEDTGDPTFLANWRVYGPSANETKAEWTKLRFRNAPIPVPINSWIFDRNGDGIGDSVAIAYNKPLDLDSLPILLEVVWGDSSNIVSFHASVAGYDAAKLKDVAEVKKLYKDQGFRSANKEYWQRFIKKGQDSIIGIAIDVAKDPSARFSKEILTAGKGNISSRIPFTEQDQCVAGSCPETAFQYTSNLNNLQDRIPPVVVKAEFKSDGKVDCENTADGCLELLTVYLSEPVFAGAAAGDNDLVKNPFSYCLGISQLKNCQTTDIDDETERFNLSYDNLGWEWNLPAQQDYAYSVTYKPSTKGTNSMAQLGNSKGDSIVESTYYSFKTTQMPKAGDWVKLRSDLAVFQDAEGNIANPKERGVIIKGSNPPKRRPIRIAAIKGGQNDPVLDGIFTQDERIPPWYGSAAKGKGETLFTTGNVAEILPVPIEFSHPDSVRTYYPGSVGNLFTAADSIRSGVREFIESCNGVCKNKEGATINDDNIAKSIVIKATAYYHTNLGDYTAHRDPVTISCADDIFDGNCLSNRYNFYLAWDLKANNGRFVGAGAYVGVSTFKVNIEYLENGKSKTKNLRDEKFIEMFGVRRK